MLDDDGRPLIDQPAREPHTPRRRVAAELEVGVKRDDDEVGERSRGPDALAESRAVQRRRARPAVAGVRVG